MNFQVGIENITINIISTNNHSSCVNGDVVVAVVVVDVGGGSSPSHSPRETAPAGEVFPLPESTVQPDKPPAPPKYAC